MAEIWPRLRKKLQQGKRSSKGKRVRKGANGAANPYASIGLEKFASILEELQTKQQAATSLVERTASSLSAARSISRSAQEWTASTLVRTASRCSPDSTKALQCAPPVHAPTAPVGELEREENLSEERQAQGCYEEVSTSKAAMPLGVRLPTRRCRSMPSKSAFFMLAALGLFLSSRAGRVGKPLAAVLSVGAVVRIWRKGKVSARFMFSSMALYFLTPLRSYFITRTPKRLTFVPQNPESAQNGQPELQDQSGSREPTPSLLPILEISPSTESLNPVTLPNAKNVGGSSSRRLAKRISSRLRKLKMFRSSSSSTSAVRVSESSAKSSASSHRRLCPFSRKAADIAEAPAPEGSVSSSSSHLGSHSKCRLLRRHQSSDNMSDSISSGPRFGRMLSSETPEPSNDAGDAAIASSACESKRPASSSPSGEPEAAPVAWPMVGLLVTLLFLVVGRVPAIMATSLFFVVVSPHSRARDRRENRAMWEAAARKLHHSPPSPRGGRRAASPPPRSF